MDVITSISVGQLQVSLGRRPAGALAMFELILQAT
jgi:hypothetical protein